MATCATALYPTPQTASDATGYEINARLVSIPLSDDILVEAAKMGNPSAFEELMDRHNRFCMSKACSILRNRDDAEDEVQNAWMQAWLHLESYQGRGSFSAWLCRIVSNQCLMRLRKAKFASLLSVDEVFESEGSFRLEVIDQRVQPEDALGDREVARVLEKEIRGVPPLLREILVMRDVRKLVMSDIAMQLGITIPAAKSRLMRGRFELRRRLAKHYGQRGGATLLQKSVRRRAAYVRAT